MSESDHAKRDAAILAIAVFAAFSDGEKDDREREELQRIADALQQDDGPDLRRILQDVLLKRTTLEDAVAGLSDRGERHLAYEMAVGVCNADRFMNDEEKAFLERLKKLLELDPSDAQEVEQELVAVAGLSETAAPVVTRDVPDSATAPGNAALDGKILNYAILCGGLEMLPRSWASMAILPLQIKMVYEIGQAHGVALDSGHVKEFIATLGVGMTSQYIEQFGRKLVGGLFRAAAGRGIGRLGRAATGMAFSFATTWAMGQVAKRYYAGGRQMSTELLKRTFEELKPEAKRLQTEHAHEIEARAQDLDMGQVMNLVRRGPAG